MTLQPVTRTVATSVARRAGRVLGRLRELWHRLLGRPAIVYRGEPGKAAVALTFDDGPSEWTLEIARTLEAHGCRGTFFLLGSAVQQRPEVVLALAEAGHEIGNHLWSHGDPERQSRAAIRSELERTAEAIRAAGGERPRLVRPPYCGAPHRVARAVAGALPPPLIVIRSVDPADWSAPTPAEIVERVLDKVTAGDIVCLHDGISPTNRGTPSRAATVAAVAALVPALIERGLQPVTVSALLE